MGTEIEEESSNSIAILSRRKSGKTVLLHRLYNIIWNQRGNIIPFYIEMEERPKWVKDFSLSRELKTRKKTRPLSERVQNYQDGTAFVDYRGVYVNFTVISSCVAVAI